MKASEFGDMVDEVWRKEKKAFLYPPLKKPKIIDFKDASLPSLLGDRILINKQFVQNFNFQEGLDYESLLSVIMARELNRYLRSPDFHQQIRLYYSLKEIVYHPKYARLFLNSYLDICNDLDLANRGYLDQLKGVYKSSINTFGMDNPTHYQVLIGVLQERWGTDFGLQFSIVYQPLISELAGIKYIGDKEETKDIQKFGHLLSRHFSKTEQTTGSTGTNTTGENTEEEGMKEPPQWPLGSPQTTYRDISDGIDRFLAEKNMDITKLDQLVDELTRLPDKLDLGDYQENMGRWQFYYQKAKRHPIPVQEKKTANIRRSYPLYHVNWNPEDSFRKLDPLASFGKPTWPGIAKRWVDSGEPQSSWEEIDLPDLIICQDSSGSMPNPNSSLSLACLTSVAVALSYIHNGSEVAVYNFSSEDKVHGFTKDKFAICKQVVNFQGGGTNLSVETIGKLIANRKQKEIDILIVTDMGLSNLDDTLDKIAQYQTMHRIFVVLEEETVSKAQKAKNKLRKTSFFTIKNEKDISKLALSAVRESFKK